MNKSGMRRAILMVCLVCAIPLVCGQANNTELACDASRIQAAQDRCAYVKANCDDSGPYVATFHCMGVLRWFLPLPYGLFLVLLFSVLGSTAEDFFSPALEQMSKA